MNEAPIFIVDIIGQVVAAADAVLFPTLNRHILYEYGRSIQIQTKLQTLNNSVTQKGLKYPLFALFQPFPETGNAGYYCAVKFPRIVIATLTNSTDPAPKRYDQTFKPILYPIWEEIKRQLFRHPNIVGNDPQTIPYQKSDYPGVEPATDPVKGVSNNDYVDAIIIQDLQLTFKQIKSCK